MRLKWEWSIFNRYFLWQFQSMKIPITPTKGLSARVPHTTHYVLFMDFDNIQDERLDDELIPLQELFHLGDFHVFKTSEFGRHTICIDEMPLREALDVVYSSSCDEMFKKGIRINEYRTWILRGWEKGERERPKFLRTVESPYNGERLQSQAHAMFLQTFYGIKIRLVNPDGNTEVEIQSYSTSSKVTVKDLEEEMKKHGGK